MLNIGFATLVLIVIGLLIFFAWGFDHWETRRTSRMLKDLQELDRAGVPLTWEVFLSLPKRHRQFLVLSKTPSFLREELNRNTAKLTGCEVVVKM